MPVGIINATVGGTLIEAWISEDGLKEFSSLQSTIAQNKDTANLDSFNKTSASNLDRQAQPADAGMAGPVKWFDVAYSPQHWRTINIPGYWEDQGLKDLNGVVWYRKEIDIPVGMVGKPAKVFLGRIVDADELYINGNQVGTTGYQYPQRRYNVAANLLKAGKNIFMIRVTNIHAKGGFVPGKLYCIFSGSETVDLKGYWQYKVGAAFNPSIDGDAGSGMKVQDQPTALYNAMVAPEVNYTIKGFCWYQGESNAGRPQEYTQFLPALIRDWRHKWKQDTLPFLYVQLTGFMDYNYMPSESKWALLREA